ncbi:MAG: hypothetical protein KKD35_01015, partial [Elusimicrobia bacterium]|nr:hypothetical protein [Elusimicrobiota bacterium]
IDLGVFLMNAMLGIFIWIVFSIFIKIFPNFYLNCYRIGKSNIIENLTNGLGVFILALIIFFGLGFLFKGSGNPLPLIFLFAVFSIGGSVIGLALLGGMGNIVDGQKHPYQAIATGMLLMVIVHLFSKEIASWVNTLIGVYGVGAMTLYFRGLRIETPEKDSISQEEQKSSSKYPEGSTKERLALKKPANNQSVLGDFGYVIMAVALLVFAFYGMKIYKKMIPNDQMINPLRQEEEKKAPSEYQYIELASAHPTSKTQRTITDIKAQMWAYRIKDGEFSYEELKKLSVNWVRPEEEKKALFVKIKTYMAVENLENITKEEMNRLDAYNKIK